MKYALLSLVSLTALPAPALADWTQPAAGITLPDEIAGLKRGETRDLSSGKSVDTILQYGTAEEPVTLYVYRSTHPNPVLWMERTAAAMQVNVGASGSDAAAVPFTLGGAAAPTGLRRAINLPEGARFRSTGVAIAQIGEWMLKLRVTSALLDAASVSAKMDRILQVVRFDRTVPAPHPMVMPAACGDAPIVAGRPEASPDAQQVAGATRGGRTVLSAVRGGAGSLAARPDLWCRDTGSGLPADVISLYRSKSGDNYVALLGDAGVSLNIAPSPTARAGSRTMAAYAGSTVGLSLVALYDGLPEPTLAVQAALPVLTGQQAGLATIDD
ncbi:hypothetical protein ABC347_04250 [Sphingomonas sp. 1P06PA]|uniref:hypothetical protein n=1 Tax=Sphingomonas sp. 1P06PA TaxID=554121 RepID=UPI0039A6FCF4